MGQRRVQRDSRFQGNIVGFRDSRTCENLKAAAIRILHTAVTYAPSLDGVAEVVRSISERMAQRGHEVHVATTGSDSRSGKAELEGVNIHRFNVKGNRTLGMRGEIDRYRRFVFSGGWDLMVNHCLQAWPTDALLNEIGIYPWPSILVTHGLSTDNPLFDSYYREITRFISSYAKWACVSKVCEEFSLAEKCRLPKPAVIRNGVDAQEWDRPTLSLRRKWGIDRKLWIVNVSNHNPWKDHANFFRLASRLRSAGARFTLIGNTYPMAKWELGRIGIAGGCAYKCRLRTVLAGNAVELKTNLERYQVVSAIQEADVVVSTSKWEANSLVLLESMAAGTPWVSFDVGSARENTGGVVVGSLGEMVNVVAELLRDADRRKRLGELGRARAAAQHDWDSITNQYEELYETALREHACARRQSTKSN